MSECESCKNKKNYPCPNSCGYMGDCDGYEPEPKTHADRIRAMSDEELAKFLWKVWRHEGDFYKSCVDGKLVPFYAWLRQEAEE